MGERARRRRNLERSHRQRELSWQTGQVRNIAEVATGYRQRRIYPRNWPHDVRGEILQLKETGRNTMVEQLRLFAVEATRVAREVGSEGRPRRTGECPRRRWYVERSLPDW